MILARLSVFGLYSQADVWVNTNKTDSYIMKQTKTIGLLLTCLGIILGPLLFAVQAGAVATDGSTRTRRIICLDKAGSQYPLDVPQTTTDYNKACRDAGYASYKGFATNGGAPAGSTSGGVACPDEGDCAKKTAFAFNCGGANTSATTNVGLSCLFITVINFMSVAVGLAVVGGVTVGGIMYSTSGGSPGKTQQGVKIIVNSLIGLVLWLMLWAIVQFLIPGGVFK